MTLKEALIAELDEIDVSDATINKTLIDRDLTANEDYTAAKASAVGRAAIDCLYRVYTRPDVKEGDYSKSHPDFTRKLEARIRQLATQHGAADVLALLDPPTAGPSVNDGSMRW